jgi:hypothetical protein
MNPLYKVPLRYAGIASVLGLVLTLVLFYSGKHPLLIPIIVDYRLLILPLFIFFAIKEYRDVYNSGVLTFPQGMLIGLIVYAGMGLLVGLSIYLFDLVIGGQFVQEYIDISYQQLVDNKQQFLDAIGEEAYQDSLETTPLTTILDLASDYFLKTCALGILFTIIISVILRKQPN